MKAARSISPTTSRRSSTARWSSRADIPRSSITTPCCGRSKISSICAPPGERCRRSRSRIAGADDPAFVEDQLAVHPLGYVAFVVADQHDRRSRISELFHPAQDLRTRIGIEAIERFVQNQQ